MLKMLQNNWPSPLQPPPSNYLASNSTVVLSSHDLHFRFSFHPCSHPSRLSNFSRSPHLSSHYRCSFFEVVTVSTCPLRIISVVASVTSWIKWSSTAEELQLDEGHAFRALALNADIREGSNGWDYPGWDYHVSVFLLIIFILEMRPSLGSQILSLIC